ncbi:MAG: DUF4276 family protein [Bacteroidetes bacterium]|nr:DUF4276 family protein [Bacteroidota bacterium]
MVERLIIEGTADTKNGNLREGFNKLLRKKLGRNMPRIVMGDGKSQAIDKFLNSSNSVLLCDLDGPDETREKDIQMHRFEEYRDSIYYMVQEMEAWFISQPDILDKFYQADLTKKIPKKHASEFENPDEKLQEWTRDSKKGKYHKVRHGTALLEMLDADKLTEDFPDFKGLIKALRESD